MIYEEIPANFNYSIEVSGVYVLYENKVLLLKRAMDKKVEPGKWGVPAGKLDDGETPILGALRELSEETGIVVGKNSVKFIRSVFVKYPGFDFIFHIFKLEVSSMPEIKLNSENIDFKWVDFEFVHEYELIMDEGECIKYALN
ncbi:NUDIX hydrolase [Candidatus Woesearchaeota archaeon]|nr:NUDIX hydrolase [Candidatus Woesearchaeota archaeon]